MRHHDHRAMTLIEMLIAIGVFAVGVLAVLQLVINNIRTVDHVSKHMDATMLATQGLELMYELRNTNSYKEVERDCLQIKTSLTNGGQTACETMIRNNTKKAITIAPAGPGSNEYRSVEVHEIGENSLDNYRLYRHVSDDNITYFSHDDNDEPTPYARYITFEQVEGHEPSIAIKINSHILIDQGNNEPKKIVISSIMGNIIE